MPTIQRRGKGYRVMVRLKGRPPQYASFERKRDAEIWGKGVETAIREGRHFSPANPEAGAARKTLAELIDRYVQDVLSVRRKGVKKTTSMLSWWKRELGAYFLPDVTPPLIAACRDKLLRESTSRGELRSPATVNRYLGALSHAMSVAAREWMWLDASPLPRVSRPKESRGRVRCLSDTEREALLAACAKSRDRRLLALAVLALSTGARQSEIVRLRWRDVDLARGMAILHETKNGERRALSLAGRALEILEAMSAAKRAGAVFVFEDAQVTPVFPRQAWKDAVAAAGLEDCMSLPTEPRGRVRCLSDAQREALLAASAESRDRRLLALVILAVSTGARQLEIVRLRWRDVDLARRVAMLPETKTGGRRAFSLAGRALEILEAMNAAKRAGAVFVFEGETVTPVFPRKAWDDAVAKAGLEDFRFHDLRHSAASYLAMSGATLAELAAVLGHKTLAMVKRYTHLTDLHTSGVVSRMNARFLGATDSEHARQEL
jgi:integrase